MQDSFGLLIWGCKNGGKNFCNNYINVFADFAFHIWSYRVCNMFWGSTYFSNSIYSNSLIKFESTNLNFKWKQASPVKKKLLYYLMFIGTFCPLCSGLFSLPTLLDNTSSEVSIILAFLHPSFRDKTLTLCQKVQVLEFVLMYSLFFPAKINYWLKQRISLPIN